VNCVQGGAKCEFDGRTRRIEVNGHLLRIHSR
jgi:hypothetical protein